MDLKEDFELAAQWRRTVAAEHPDDSRNLKAAATLDQLAETVAAINPEVLATYEELFEVGPGDESGPRQERKLSKLVAKPGLRLVLGKMTVQVRVREKRTTRQNRGLVDEGAEIAIAVFRPQRPIVGEGIVNSPTDGPSDTLVRKRGVAAAKSSRVISVYDLGDRDTASGIEQRTTIDDAQPSANRTLHIRFEGREAPQNAGHTPSWNDFSKFVQSIEPSMPSTH